MYIMIFIERDLNMGRWAGEKNGCEDGRVGNKEKGYRKKMKRKLDERIRNIECDGRRNKDKRHQETGLLAEDWKTTFCSLYLLVRLIFL